MTHHLLFSNIMAWEFLLCNIQIIKMYLRFLKLPTKLRVLAEKFEYSK